MNAPTEMIKIPEGRPSCAIRGRCNPRRRRVDLDKKVVALFFKSHDRRNPLHRQALLAHLNEHRQELRHKLSGSVSCRLRAPEVIKKIIEYRVLDACHNLAILEQQAVAARKAECKHGVVALLVARQAYFLSDEESIDVDRLVVVKKDKARELVLLKKVVDFSQALSSGAAPVSLEDACNGQLPADFEENDGLKQYASDLGRVLVHEGEKARDVVNKICSDGDFAKEVADDQEFAAPLRFLASVCLKIRAFSCSQSEQQRKVGFGA